MILVGVDISMGCCGVSYFKNFPRGKSGKHLCRSSDSRRAQSNLGAGESSEAVE